MAEIVACRRIEPDKAIISGLIATGELTDEEVTGVSFLPLVVGHETTANMLALDTFALLSNPDQLAALRADPSLITGAVNELLRYLTIVQFSARAQNHHHVTGTSARLPPVSSSRSRSDSTGTARRSVGNRLSRAGNSICSSMRAKGAPRQKCGP